MPSYRDLAKMIDHSLLKPTLTRAELEEGCDLAARYDVATVCVLPSFLEAASKLLDGTDVLPTTTIGFPHGAHTTATKLFEAEDALGRGARELDMVVNLSWVKSGAFDEVREELFRMTTLTHARGHKLKVIFENCCLHDAEKIRLCEISGELGVDWVKTSTGFGSSGATVSDVRLMRAHSPPSVQVKAAGGVKDLDMLLRVREAGATRSGSSATAAILDEARRRLASGALTRVR
jgi:deoxyribose-phosphate aldolase